MKKDFELPNKIPVFPLSNFIIFPNTNVPLNIEQLFDVFDGIEEQAEIKSNITNNE